MGWPTWTPGMPTWLGPQATGYSSGSWSSPGYRSARIRGRWCKVFFVCAAVAAAIEVIYLAVGFTFVNQLDNGGVPSITYSDFLTWAQATDGWAAITLLCALVLVITVPVWFSRTIDNLPPLAGGTPAHSPRGAIGWWFLPIANLLMPFLMTREAWHRYATPKRNGHDWVLIVWWLSYNIGFTLWVVRQIIFRQAATASDYETWLRGLTGGLAVGVLGFSLIIVAAITFFYIVNELGHRAGERASMLGLEAPEARWAGQPGYPGPQPGYPGPQPGQYAPPYVTAGPPPSYPPYPAAPAPNWGASGQMPPAPGQATGYPLPGWPQAPTPPTAYPQPGPTVAQGPVCRNCSSPLVPGQPVCRVCGMPVA